jgi:hypothetical protein
MKKFYLIILSLLICSHLFAEMKVPGSGIIEDAYVNEVYKKQLKKAANRSNDILLQNELWVKSKKFLKLKTI